MTEIKICGMTNIEDARFAAESGVDALGFIFYPKSPRYVQPKTAWDIIRKLPPEVAKTGVFVNHDTQDIKEIMEYCGLNFIQLHGNESPEYCRYFPESVIIKALSPRTEEDLNILEEYQARAILVDTYAPEKHGGTGKISNWELAVKIKKRRP
ncbi:MAG: phosphoribosylanthranilate isomerase, partial [Thermodesulfobacteriota bacterium]|nr:phosphoribosylanthranilate isomerase [Thermodesulfobacteriota bacterium]